MVEPVVESVVESVKAAKTVRAVGRSSGLAVGQSGCFNAAFLYKMYQFSATSTHMQIIYSLLSHKHSYY